MNPKYQHPGAQLSPASVPTGSARDRREVYVSGALEIDFAGRELRSRGIAVPIGSRALEIIEVLVQSAGRIVTKDDLIARVWPGAIVEENTLQVHISAIRKGLGADRGMLKTVSGRGYRLLGSWTVRHERVVSPVPAPPASHTGTLL